MEKKEGKGNLYHNMNKNKPKQPDMTGYLMFKGEEIKLSVWKNTSADGKEYFSLMVSTFEPNKNALQKEVQTQDDEKDKLENYTNQNIPSKQDQRHALMSKIVNDDINDMSNILDLDDDPF